MEHDVLHLWRQGKRPGKISRSTGIPVGEVCRIIANASKAIVSVQPQRYDGWGRPELRNYIVARRTTWADWDNPEGIAQARLDYEAGLVEMCQGRDGDVIIQYSIPRKTPCKPRVYFTEVVL